MASGIFFLISSFYLFLFFAPFRLSLLRLCAYRPDLAISVARANRAYMETAAGKGGGFPALCAASQRRSYAARIVPALLGLLLANQGVPEADLLLFHLFSFL